MRQFLVVAHDAPATADFPLDGLASEAGRMDLLARALNAALLESHGIREDVRAHLVIDDVTVSVDGATVRNLHPDERSIAALVRSALGAREDAIGHQPAEPSPGVAVYRMGLAATLDRLAGEGTIVQLHEDGDPAVDVPLPTDPVFVLSDHREFTDDEAELLAEQADTRIRLGPRPLHADHAISVAHNWLDTDGYTEY
ncbi:tRNA (pseudouridine(54)-N(1))-methyltransferase TrmY [Halapricum hydrolyticum]|uniref:tRNA (pseudouridine(54)-N(1))-methyltransferase n=1 Tax=Halapricum hydrolyticum TaxID=2979991 RepID=A0AAE3I9J9_9EURY|nr:tRNA (pseudouridine(54)-N(1))-methyltransferase TrmY [Halapricum hydrolyticum]MCU4716851.1 tRNA (pseudouridine(54)-N(1))-methyltransferase TrmY [Halapricum hydrolyticum]MCU4725544.1 tRNA (pseudouridine(54)-N(1))-methyltransferase TrmY [Halapricum hydrolyticum]